MAHTLRWSVLCFVLLSVWAQDFYEQKTGPTRVKTRGQKAAVLQKHEGQGEASLYCVTVCMHCFNLQLVNKSVVDIVDF